MLPGEAVSGLSSLFAEIEEAARAEFASEGLEGEAQYSLDLRYTGQGYELNVPWDAARPSDSVAEFHRAHEQRYGFCDAGKAVQIVSLRLRMIAAAETWAPARRELVSGHGRAARSGERPIFFDGEFVPSSIYRRELLRAGDGIEGPALITEYSSVTVLPPGCRAGVDACENLVITIGEVGP